jgi:ABC-type multidrug transport system fused ATPase/permease subunit
MIQRLTRWLGKYFRATVYARLAHYLRPYKFTMIPVVLILVAQVGIDLLEPVWLPIMINSGLGDTPLPDWIVHWLPFLSSDHRAAIVVFAVVFGLLVRLVGYVLNILAEYLKSRVNEGMILSFQADLFRHLQKLSFSYHDQTSVGDSLYRLNNDTGFISTHLWGNFRHLLSAGLTLVGMFWVVLLVDWQLALLALAVAPILYFSVKFYGKFFRVRSRRVKEMESDAQTVLEEVLSCLRVVKAFGQEEREQKRFEDKGWAALFARLRLSVQQSLFSSAVSFATKVTRSLILLVGGLQVLAGHLKLGTLLMIYEYVGKIHGPMEDIGQTLAEMQLSMASAERVLEVLDTEPEIQDKPGAKAPDDVHGAVAFENVEFAYSADHPVLKDVDFTVQPGEVIAIVGPTGAGKTTLASLIARFYDPKGGRVTLDGHDLRDLTVRTLRDNIALVIQEPILFSTTIRDNIAYGRPDATREEIEEAARAANAHDFILALPEGYATQVGERGVRLSGGERQRIALARAFLMDAPILILDEPTSSVDSRTELVIIDALDRLMANRTTFIIAHRLSTIRRADQILVIDQGRIVERGTHAELLARAGTVRRAVSHPVPRAVAGTASGNRGSARGRRRNWTNRSDGTYRSYSTLSPRGAGRLDPAARLTSVVRGPWLWNRVA